MGKKNWIILVTVFLITLGIIIFGVIKLVGNSDDENGINNESDLKDNFEEQEEQNENEEDIEMELEKNKEVPEEEIKNTRKLEEKLGLQEGELLSHTEIQKDRKSTRLNSSHVSIS